MTLKGFKANRFGQSTYTCRLCNHVTRNTGGDEQGVELCLLCFEICGHENTMSDTEPGSDDYEYAAEQVMKLTNRRDERNKAVAK